MRRVAFAIFGTIAGLVGLLTFKTHPSAVAAGGSSIVGTTNTGGTSSGSGTAGSASTGSTTTGSAAAGSTSSSAAGPTGSSSAAAATKTVTGDSVDTRWGPVQVKITVTDGKITNAIAVDYPQNNGRDQEINSYAVPTLEQESIGQTTSKIDMVSGATYTSTGYIESLQSALDKL